MSKNFIIKKITLIKLTCLHFGEARYASSDVENLGEAIRGVFRVIMTAFDYKMREREQWNGTKTCLQGEGNIHVLGISTET